MKLPGTPKLSERPAGISLNNTTTATTLVDAEDYEYLNQWRWYVNPEGYAFRAEVVLTMKAEPGGTTIERGGDTANDGPGSQPTTSGTTVKTTPTANGGTTETSVGTTGGDTQKTDGPSTNLVPIDPTVPDGTTGRTACKGNDAEPTDGQVTNPPTVEILSPGPPSVVANERKRRLLHERSR